MKQIAKEGIAWRARSGLGLRDPDERARARPREVRLRRRYYSPEKYRALVDQLRVERRAWLAQFPGLDSAIPQAIEA